MELQNKLPKARVVYASATGMHCWVCIECLWMVLLALVQTCVLLLGASEPRNMAYMNRLGIWGEGTPFREFSDFIQAVERR